MQAIADSADNRALLETGLAHHRAGRHKAAERLYRRVLERDPGNANALNLMGLIAHEAGRQDEALAMLQRAVARQPDSAVFQRNLAAVLQAAGEHRQAVAAFRRARQLAPQDAGIHNDLGTALNALGEVAAAAEAFAAAAALAPDAAPVQYNLGNALARLGRREAAAAALRQALAADPGLGRARHVLDSLTGGHSLRPPDDYVRHLFDDYAERFEEDLVDRLGYRVPALLRALVDEVAGGGEAAAPGGAGAPRFQATLDLGCGTGLSGAAFRDLTARLVGVDLSPRMLARAAGRRIYDELVTGPIADYWPHCRQRFDLFLAMDVFIYVGDLKVLFAGAARHAAAGALFVFSTELLPAAADEAGVKLLPSGRYAHAPHYIDRVAGAAGFALLARRPMVLRQGDDGPVAGEGYVLEFGGHMT